MITLQEYIEDKDKLPSPPAIALKILDAVREEEGSFDSLADIIKSDPALTAQTLKIANSSLYGLPDKVTSLSQAISVIGTKALKNIALSFVIMDDFKDAPQGSFDLDLFWRRAVTSAVSAEVLADSIKVDSSDLFVASLLQDFGVLVLFLSCADTYTEVLDNKRITGQSLLETELDRFGFHHAEVGYQLFKQWNLPISICEPIRQHHSPELADNGSSQEARILQLADMLSSIYHGNQSNRKSIEVRQQLLTHFNMDEEAATMLIDSVGEKAREMMQAFSIDPGETKPFTQIMQEANEELGRLNYSYEQMVLELTQAKHSAEQLARELKQANDNLRELTFRDSLTNLYNHRYFQEVFETELNKSKRYGHHLSLLLLDIDHFKKVNDSYGHLTGDHVLIEISKVLVKLVRHCDIVARYGGEEFAILLPETGLSGAKVLAQRLRRGVEQHRMEYDGEPLRVTTSIGLSSTEMPDMEKNRKSMIASSDQALYSAKHAGRNRVELFQGFEESQV